MRILLVEDDTLLAQILVDHLTAQRYVVDVAIDGMAGFDYAQAADYDLIVLDINLPKLDGIRLCQLLRQHRYTMPILLLTARGDSSDKVLGLDAGADDYVVKPCTVEEISARIRALLRRFSMEGTPLLHWGTLCLNPVTCEVTCNEQPLSLSPKEYSLLELLLRNPQRVFSSSSILEHLWSFEDAPSEETIRSHIKRLRRKVKAAVHADPIETVYGLGYRLKPPVLKVASPAARAASPAVKARAAAMAAWEKFQQPVLERVALIDRAVTALETGALTDDLRQNAAQAAHKLAGSLALFGFTAGTQLGRDLEQRLLAPCLTVAAIKPLVEELHQVLQSPEPDPADNPHPSAASNLFQDHCAAGSQSNPAGKLHVLLVDSDSDLAQQFQTIAADQSIQLTAVVDPAKAGRWFIPHPPAAAVIDLALINQTETERSWLAELTAQFPQISVIALMAQDSFSQRLAGLRQGCDRFIPRTLPPEEILAIVQKALQQRLPEPRKILAVDDDPLVLQQLDRCLAACGIDVTTLNSPDAVWQTLEALQPDLVILDVEMPSVSGLELCQVIRRDRTWGNLPILFLTAQQEPEAILEIYRAGADDYVSKPFTETEVVTRIFNRLARSRS